MTDFIKKLFGAKDKPRVPKGYPDPTTVFCEYPLAIRAQKLMDFAASLRPSLSDDEFIKSLRGYIRGNNPDLIRRSEVVQHVADQYQNEGEKICRALISQFETAREFEKKGDLPQAIAIYEYLIKECYIGTAPYDRLRIIYSKQKNYPAAIRVCQKLIDNYTTYKDVLPPADQHSIPEFQSWVEKYKKKVADNSDD